jgi:uncharacterized protein YbgA (DUF1722 family)/uncharacterized protein YbbK (DUF523 family)
MAAEQTREQAIRIGISMCLLGEKVRFDAGHKKDRYLTDILGKYFEWVPFCPEVEAGMGVPREPVRLTGTVGSPRMVGVKSGEEWTERMEATSQRLVRQLVPMKLRGVILKSDSPSCGMERVKVYGSAGMPSKNGRGLFAEALMRAFPLVPVEEEGRLNDAGIRESFIERVFSYDRLRMLLDGRWSAGLLVGFHTAHKYLMLSHSPAHYTRLGRLVADAKKIPVAELREIYAMVFMDGLAVRATVKKHVNVLQHIVGFLRGKIGDEEKRELLGVIEDYRREIVPLVVPVTLIRHCVMRYNVEYILGQVYLSPHPKELMLRNHV